MGPCDHDLKIPQPTRPLYCHPDKLCSYRYNALSDMADVRNRHHANQRFEQNTVTIPDLYWRDKKNRVSPCRVLVSYLLLAYRALLPSSFGRRWADELAFAQPT